MEKMKGFRADRLREAMKENGASFDDIYDVFQEEFEKSKKELCPFINFKYRLLNIADGCRSIEPTIEELYIICYAVGCSADYLLGLKDEMY